VHGLALLISLALALALAPALLRGMRESRLVRANYRGRELPFPFGVLVVIAALTALLVLAPLQRAWGDVLHPETGAIALYMLGVAFLGLLDDALGQRLAGAPRGLSGHGRALLSGEISTGAIKALGSAGLALYATSLLHPQPLGRWLLASAVLVLATHAFNLLDLRPGRTLKALAVLGAALTLAAGARALYALGAFLGPALVAGLYDLRERSLLGDTGASAFGGLAGLWLVLTLSTAGQAVALIALLAISLFGELRSISALIERLPLLGQLDSLGRPSR
jgi:UDP-GlcNAc:undecaprenyl-phosphate/decaprenyl-phosphate GlcNAc-1-phosphate transferase